MTETSYSPVREDMIRAELFRMGDPAYREFICALLPTVDPSRVIGVRTPPLRALARELIRQEDCSSFLCSLPHALFEENQLHAFLLSEMKDYGTCIEGVRLFLPYVDNWATCDQLSPPVFRKHKTELLGEIRQWLASGGTYTVRFAVEMLMRHFLDEDFDPAFPRMVAELPADEYYVSMMIAWYFAPALAKQYAPVLPYLEKSRLDVRTHNRTIQKAVESRRITSEQKTYLRTLRRESV